MSSNKNKNFFLNKFVFRINIQILGAQKSKIAINLTIFKKTLKRILFRYE